jgi:hypothetical protein
VLRCPFLSCLHLCCCCVRHVTMDAALETCFIAAADQYEVSWFFVQVVLGNPAATWDGTSWRSISSISFSRTENDPACNNWIWGSYCGGQAAPGGASTGLSGWIMVGGGAEAVRCAHGAVLRSRHCLTASPAPQHTQM